MDNIAENEDIESIEESYDLLLIKTYPIPQWVSYSYENQNFIDLSSDLNNEALIEMIEYNTSGYYLCDPIYPDDYYFNSQPYLEKIQAPYAWGLSTGDQDIIVAILDSGFDWEHDDLGPGDDSYDNIYLIEAEEWEEWDNPASGDDEDNDNNGYTDDWKGWGEMYFNYQWFTGNDVRHYDEAWLESIFPLTGHTKWLHGTLIAGIIGAKTNNGVAEGLVGIAGGWNCKGTSLVLYKIGAMLFTSNIVDGIFYAVDKLTVPQQARIIEMAFGTGENELIIDAIDHAYENGAFLVAASGNKSGPIGFPANYSDKVFAVGATDEYDYIMNVSNWGSGQDLCAPGYTTDYLVPGDDIETGAVYTSGASAMVVGTAALILSIKPDLSPFEIGYILCETADEVNPQTYNYDGIGQYGYGWDERMGYGRLNAYNAVCMAMDYGSDIEITEDKLWCGHKAYKKNVYVKSGATLTINGEVEFGPAAKLVIEPGGTVILDGGTLTNLKCCVENVASWPGVEVWGNAIQSQKYMYGQNAQGVLIMNNAKIEYAISAVELWKPDDYSKTGGVIQATGSTFLNNKKSIHACYYSNFDPLYPGIEIDNASYFDDCTFEINSDYIGDYTFYKHADLARVRGINFLGCNFFLDGTNNISPWNLGIAAYDAGFTVTTSCQMSITPCPPQYLIPSEFNGFYWAIGSFTSGQSISPFSVNGINFDNNNTGVYISGVDNAVVINCNFEIGYNQGQSGECGEPFGIGIDVHSAIGFAIEDNYFTKNINDPSTGIFAGVRVFDCPSIHDIIYRNEFEGLSFGNYAEGQNRSDPNNDETGVEYQCNTNIDNSVDFIVTDSLPSRAMIRRYQGEKWELPCGNKFSENPDLQFKHESRRVIDWTYSSSIPDEFPDPNLIFELYDDTFFTFGDESINECPAHYGGGGQIELTGDERLQKETDYAQNLSDYNSVGTLYASLIDGGDTDAELSDIQSAQPDDMWNLRTQLLGHSPHLSQEVLREMSDRTDVFPDDILLEILSANPDELKRDTLLDYLAQKENPLPPYMIEILRQAAEGITYKTILEVEMSEYFSNKTQAAQDIIRDVLFDSIVCLGDYRNWLDNIGSIESDKQIISSYLSEGDTSSALSLLNLIPTLYSLDGEALEEFIDYKDLVEMQLHWNNLGKTIYELDSVDLMYLEIYAVDGKTTAGNIARNILTYAYGYHFCDCMHENDSAFFKIGNSSIMGSISEAYGPKIVVEPNPARSWTVFKYELPNDQSEGIITIMDISGKIIERFTVNGMRGEKIWDIRLVKPGIYYYTFIASGLINSGKIVIN